MMEAKVDLSEQQMAALEQVRDWLRSGGGGGVFRVFGYAGTGKTTLIKYLIEKAVTRPGYWMEAEEGEDWNEEEGRGHWVGEYSSRPVATYTGKAAQVLRNKGIRARTIHSLIYRSVFQSREELHALLVRVEDVQGMERVAIEHRIAQLREFLSQPHFELNREAFSGGRPEVIILDECSMIGRQIGEDLLSFGVPVLVFGDPMQLPPVKKGSGETGYFTEAEPDVMLTEIHRQAAGNPILKMASLVREGGRLERGAYGESEVARYLPERWWEQYDQTLVGLNATKDMRNRQARAGQGYAGALPCVGEKLICLRNNHERGLLNGSQWSVLEVKLLESKGFEPFVRLHLQSLDEADADVVCDAWRELFTLGQVEFMKKYPFYTDRLAAQEFDYGYAMTVHKAQGSEWPRVMLLDESSAFRRGGTHVNWLYTGITRAAQQLTVIR